MKRCSFCNSFDVESTGRILTSYPPQIVYKCNACGRTFNVSVDTPSDDTNYEVKMLDVTEVFLYDFLKELVNNGEFLQSFEYFGKQYAFVRIMGDYFIYYNSKNKNTRYYIKASKELIEDACALHDKIVEFYEGQENGIRKQTKV